MKAWFDMIYDVEKAVKPESFIHPLSVKGHVFFLRLGLDPKMLAKILNMSTGRSWSSELYNPCPGVLEGVPSSNNYQGGFGTALMTKVC